MKYEYLCAMLAAHNLRQAGVSIAVIAREAGKHPSTIRRWLSYF